MTAETYRKKPVEIQAMQYGKDNAHRLTAWMEANLYPFLVGDTTKPETLRYRDQVAEDDSTPDKGIYTDPATGLLVIRTLEGDMRVAIGDFVIRGVEGEFYPCKPGIFAATYDAGDDETAAEAAALFAVQEGRILDARVALSEALRQLEAVREGLRTLPLDPNDNSFRRVQAHVVRQMDGIDDAIKTVVANHGSGAKREAVALQPGIWIAGHGGVLTVTASPDVQDTITDFMAAHQSELDALLAPHGITLNDLARPTYQRVITRILLTAAIESGEI